MFYLIEALVQYTVFRKEHPLMFSVVSLWKMLRFAKKNFRECLLGNKYSENGEVRYSLLPVTSC